MIGRARVCTDGSSLCGKTCIATWISLFKDNRDNFLFVISNSVGFLIKLSMTAGALGVP